MSQANRDAPFAPPAILPKDLRPGDVLLSLGDKKLSRAIRALDGGHYSHAALWTGDGVIEATYPRVVEHARDPGERALDRLPAGGVEDRIYVDAYRHERAAASQAADAVAKARRLNGRPYAVADLLLTTAVLTATSFIPRTQTQQKLLMLLFGFNYDDKADLTPKKDELVVCTELVARAYAEAGAPIPIEITGPNEVRVGVLVEALVELVSDHILPQILRDGAGDGPPDRRAWEELQTKYERRRDALLGAAPGALVVRAPPTHEAGKNYSADKVTLRHLEESPQLRLLGRVHSSAKASKQAEVEQRVYGASRYGTGAPAPRTQATLLDRNPYVRESSDEQPGPPCQRGCELPSRVTLAWDDFTFDVSAANRAAVGAMAQWSVSGYFAADCDLARMMFDNVMEMKAIGSSPAMHVSVLFAGPFLTDSFFARLHRGTSLRDDLLLRFRGWDTDDSTGLAKAIGWADRFPAGRRALFLGGHGHGWRRMLRDEELGKNFYEARAAVTYPQPEDECWARLARCEEKARPLIEVPRSGPRGRPFEVIAFDLCYGGNIETLANLNEEAEIFVVSQDAQPGTGFPYALALGQLEMNPELSPEELARILVRKHTALAGTQVVALSSVGLRVFASDFVALARDVDVTDDAIFSAVDIALEKAREALRAPTTPRVLENIDVKAFIENLAEQRVPEIVRSRCRDALASWSRMIIKSTTAGGPHAQNGLSIYAPRADAEGKEQFDPVYIERCNGLKLDLGIWAWFLGGYYLKALGGDASKHRLVRAIRATMEKMIREGTYRPG